MVTLVTIPIGVIIFKCIIIFLFVNLLKLRKSLLDFNFESLQGSEQCLETFGMIQVVEVWHNSFIQGYECWKPIFFLVQLTKFISMSCDEVSFIDNQFWINVHAYVA